MAQCKNCGSRAINHNDHGRDGTDPELCDVCYWRKRAEYLQAAQAEPVAWIDATRFEELKTNNLMTTLTKHKAFIDDVPLYAHPVPAVAVNVKLYLALQSAVLRGSFSCDEDETAAKAALAAAKAERDAIAAAEAAKGGV